MDKIRTFLEQMITKNGFDLAYLSKQIGKNHAYLQQYFKRGVPKYLPEDIRYKLAKLLGCEEQDLKPIHLTELENFDPSEQKSSLKTSKKRTAFGKENWFNKLVSNQDLPIYGTVKGGLDPNSIDWIYPALWVPMPDELNKVSGSFGLFITDQTMEPRYYQGEIVYCHPQRPLTKNCYVIIVTKEQKTLVRRLINQTADTIDVAQLNPYILSTLTIDVIDKIYRIVGSREY
ncbi:MAG: hypothetical protein K1X44_05670 [Alphaproteobacteria bacterium]|nr:hypothetical protein [Alphaproteobacteria bacterium]